MENSSSERGAIYVIIGLIIGSLLSVALFGLFLIAGKPHTPVAETPVGLYATESAAVVATSSQVQVGPQNVVTIFSAADSCANRIVSNLQTNTTLILSFDTNVTPSATAGHPFAASTTHALAASVYGCGAVRAYAAASTTITRTVSIR